MKVTKQVAQTSEQENFLYDDVQSSLPVEHLPVVLTPASNPASTLDLPQPQPVEQSIHTIKDRQRMNRRKWLNRVGAFGLSLLVAGAGGLAGDFYAVDREQQKELASLAQNGKQQAVTARSQGATQGYKQGYKQGSQQATTSIAKSLEKLDGVSLSDAKSSADILLSLNDAYIAPIANSQASVTDMLNALTYARRFVADSNGDTASIDSLITILGNWQKNAASLNKSLDQVSTTDTTAAGQYLSSLQKQIVLLEK